MHPTSTFDPDRLRRARERRGLTQARLARMVGVAGGERVSKWERGVVAPTMSMRARLAEVLDVDMVDLLSASGEDDLHRLRLKAGLTLEELASLGRVGVSSVKRWESGSGTRVVRVPLDGVADALGVTVDEVRAAIARGRLS